MSLKLRIVLLTLIPLLLMTAAVGITGRLLSERLAAAQGELLQTQLMHAREEELSNLLTLAEKALPPGVFDPARDPDAVLAEVRPILARLSFRSNGYFFLYDDNGTNLAHPRQPELQGRNLWDYRDSRGCYVIRELLAVARHGGGQRYVDQDRRGCYVLDALTGQDTQPGGGFLRYRWLQPSVREDREKLGLGGCPTYRCIDPVQ